MNLIAFTLAIAPIAYVWTKDSRMVRGGSCSIYDCVLRMLSKNVKPFVKLAVGSILLFIVVLCSAMEFRKPETALPSTGGGPETEQFARFMNRVTYVPQLMMNGFIVLFQIFILSLVAGIISLKNFYIAHATVCNYSVLALYIVWLVVNTLDVVKSEFPGTPEGKQAQAPRVAATLTVFSAIAAAVVLTIGPSVVEAFNFFVFHTKLS